MSRTEKTKIEVPLLGKLGVKLKYFTKEQLKRALLLRQEAEDEGGGVTLPEILITTKAILPEDMKKLHKIKDDYESKQQAEKPNQQAGKPEQQAEKSEPDEISFIISEDKLKVEFIISEKYNDNISTKTVLEKLQKDGIKFGIVKDYEIENYFKNVNEHGKPKLIARGTPVFMGKRPVIECFFNSEYFRNELLEIGSKVAKKKKVMKEVEEGDLLVEKTSMIPPDSGIDVFGETIEVESFDDVVMRAGFGTELFEKEKKIVAKTDGVPFLSVNGKVNVFQTVKIKGNYGVVSGPVEKDSNLIVNGIVSGEYPIKGGSIAAIEIRDANIDVLGDINVDIGITGSVIKCQGDIRAKYIHGSVIETYGSVISEKEIIDSTIITSGVCKSEESKIIASVVAAKRGVKAVGIGTETSVPCEITIGKDVNVQKNIQRIEDVIKKNCEFVAELKDKSIDFTEEQQNVNQKLKALMDYHQQINNAISTTDNNIAALELKESPDELLKAKKTLMALKNKNKKTALSIREISDTLQEISSEITKIPEEVLLIEKDNVELELDKKYISEWEKKNESVSVLEVKGDIATGTIVSGEHTFEEMKKRKNVIIKEKPVKGSDPYEWKIDIRSLE